MENVTILNGLIAFLGMIFYFLIKYKNRKYKKAKFDFDYWIQENSVDLLISIAVSMGLFLSIDDIAFLVGKYLELETPPIRLTAFLSGVAGQGLVLKVTKYLK